MKGKLGLLVGGAIGYVLGTRAGREQYDKIVAQGQSLWGNPKVQDAKSQAQDFAKQKGPEVGQKVADAASGAASAAQDKVGSGSSGGGTTGTSSSSSSPTPSPSSPSSPSTPSTPSSPSTTSTTGAAGGTTPTGSTKPPTST